MHALVGSSRLRADRLQIRSTQDLDSRPNPHTQGVPMGIREGEAQAVTLQALTLHQRQSALLFRLQGVGDRAPTGTVLGPNRIQNGHPIQTLMSHSMSQPSRLMATESIAMGRQ